MSDYEANMDGSRKRQKSTTSANEDLEQLVLRWIQDANMRRIGITGALIQESARKFAVQLGLTEFKGSNGWLDKFLKRRNLVCKTMSGERGDVSQDSVSSWKERLPNLCDGYEPRDIFNMDESGIFFKLGSSTTYCAKDEDCAGGKKAKNRVTVALCASMTGEKLKPLVIGRCAKPRCFRKVNVDSLPVTYRFNKKAWMNGKLFEEWVKGVDRKMRRQNRKILLFLDNASSHQELNLPNVKIVKLPANCTSVLQPMDQGIIQALKLKFYKQQSQFIISRMENSSLCGSDLLKEVTVLDTIYWISKAWNDVTNMCIMRCFDKCGFDKVRQQPLEDDSDDEDDDSIPLAQLARAQSIYGCSLQEVVNTEVEANDNELVDLEQPLRDIIADDDGSDSDSEVEVDTVVAEGVTLSEAQQCVEKLKAFASEKGHAKLLTSVMDISSHLTEISVKNMSVQKKISDFFK